MFNFIKVLVLLAFMASCAHKTVDESSVVYKNNPIFNKYYNEYTHLAKKRGILFKNRVLVTFFDTKSDQILGECVYSTPRIVGINEGYWNSSDKTDKRILLDHELTHCLCDRLHDYGAGTLYPTVLQLNLLKTGNETEGYYSDKCPLSVMYPFVISSKCFTEHRSNYEKEMFNRCKPY